MTDLDAGAMMTMVKTGAGADLGMNGELGGRTAAFVPLPVTVTAATAGQQLVSAPEPGPGPEMALVSMPVSQVTGRGGPRPKRETKAKKPAAAAGTGASAGTGTPVRRRAGAPRKPRTPGAMPPQTSIIIAAPPGTTPQAATFTSATSSGAAPASTSAASGSASSSGSPAGLGSPSSSASQENAEGPAGLGGCTSAHSSLRAWLRRRQALGASAQDLVFELHVRQGRPLVDVAELLGISLAGAQEHWRALRAEMAAAAPRQEADFTMLREHLAANLWVIVEQTHPREVVVEAGMEVETALPPCPRLLALRLRALDQISKLYGVNLERPAEPTGPPPYAAPPEIAQEVRRKVLALHGRDEQGMEYEDGTGDSRADEC